VIETAKELDARTVPGLAEAKAFGVDDTSKIKKVIQLWTVS
jgi:hypothetical protein